MLYMHTCTHTQYTFKHKIMELLVTEALLALGWEDITLLAATVDCTLLTAVVVFITNSKPIVITTQTHTQKHT